MFCKLDDFYKALESHTGATKRILGTLTDENLNQAVAEGHRTLGQIAWHMVTTVPEMMSGTKLPLSAIDPKAPPPRSADEIRSGYDKVYEEMSAAIKKDWTDETLGVVDNLYGEEWPRGLTLGILINHEVHHRGQMTVLLRQAGAKVPGVFGPAKEEWAQHGMETPPW